MMNQKRGSSAFIVSSQTFFSIVVLVTTIFGSMAVPSYALTACPATSAYDTTLPPPPADSCKAVTFSPPKQTGSVKQCNPAGTVCPEQCAAEVEALATRVCDPLAANKACYDFDCSQQKYQKIKKCILIPAYTASTCSYQKTVVKENGMDVIKWSYSVNVTVTACNPDCYVYQDPRIALMNLDIRKGGA